MKCRRVNKNEEDYDVLIDRSSKWGNPFSCKKKSRAPYIVKTRKESIECHREWLVNGEGQYLLEDLHELKGKVIACWCSRTSSCHGDIIVKLVNNLGKKGLEVLFE